MAFFRGIGNLVRLISALDRNGLHWVLVGLEELGHTQATADNFTRQRIRSAIRDFDVLRTQQQTNRDGLRDVREALEKVRESQLMIVEELEKLVDRDGDHG